MIHLFQMTESSRSFLHLKNKILEYNLKRVINIIENTELIKDFKSLFSSIFLNFLKVNKLKAEYHILKFELFNSLTYPNGRTAP